MISIGVDIGQAKDFTVIAVVDAGVLRFLQRMPLGVKFQEMVDRVTEIHGKLKDARVAVDATGVGRPVIELFKIPVIPVTTTPGTQGPHWGEYGLYVSKQFLISKFAVAIENGSFSISKGIDAEALHKELRAYKQKITNNATVTYEAMREKDHDDMVSACALANLVHFQEEKKDEAHELFKLPEPNLYDVVDYRERY
jgi:hypothetical protein